MAMSAKQGRSSTRNSDGLQLSEIESETMDTLWTSSQPMTANEVVAKMFAKRHSEGRELPNYTTLASMLTRLTLRELLVSTKLSPRNIVYAPKLGRIQYAAKALDQLMRQVLQRGASQIVCPDGTNRRDKLVIDLIEEVGRLPSKSAP